MPSLYLVDGSTYIFRAYFAIRSLSNSKGFPTNALYGFTAMLLKLIEDEKPDYLAVVFDLSEKTFRNDLYPEYKGHRPPAPEDLVPQFPITRDITRAFNIPALQLAGYEADDIIATLAHQAQAHDVDTVIVTSDKDLMQMVGPRCVMLDTMKNKRFDEAGVVEKWGVRADQIVDMLALMGDSVDNIPGVKGIGPKTAATLLQTFETLDGVYANIETQKGKRKENLIACKEIAYLSQELATVKRDVPINVSLDDMVRREPNREALSALFAELEFSRWQRKYHVPSGGDDSDDDAAKGSDANTSHDAQAPAALSSDGFVIVSDEAGLKTMDAAVREAAAQGQHTALTPIPSTPNPSEAHLVGIAVATSASQAWYVPIAHQTLDAVQAPAAAIQSTFAALLSDAQIPKTLFDMKLDLQLFETAGFTLAACDFDPMLASYLLDAGKYHHTIENIAMARLDHKAALYKEIGGTGKKAKAPGQLSPTVLGPWACERAQITQVLTAPLADALVAKSLDGLYREMEHPLAIILAKMEATGVAIDSTAMRSLSDELGARARKLEDQAHVAAGRVFGIGSPKQLAEVLFGELGLTPIKKTKTGFSTNSTVLDKLADLHPLPALVLEWRKVSKLKSTYTDVLPTLVNPRTGRIHTRFNQAVAATGRLSSESPNLQNIPIRTEDGKRIRQAFIPAPGKKLIACDYSQIELRILAHLSGDLGMQKAFNDGADIHRRTAAQMFGLDEASVTREQRGMAKTINFGILYGMSAFRLANEQQISRKEAAGFIDAYYGRYPRIRQWKDEILEAGRAQGFVSTLYGRVRSVADLGSRNGIARSAAERVAINTPVQGTAADIIKAAMVTLAPRLEAELPDVQMVLQVHDELVFEAAPQDCDATIALATEVMSDIIPLAVPLVVNACVGDNWLEAH